MRKGARGVILGQCAPHPFTACSIVKDIHFRKIHSTGELFLMESGVYKLVFRSNKPKAEKFTDWVTDEVLHSIRKEGKYIAEQFS